MGKPREKKGAVSPRLQTLQTLRSRTRKVIDSSASEAESEDSRAEDWGGEGVFGPDSEDETDDEAEEDPESRKEQESNQA